jgi:hypothetical protein
VKIQAGRVIELPFGIGCETQGLTKAIFYGVLHRQLREDSTLGEAQTDS